MTADLFELRKARKRRSIPIPAGACRILGLLGMEPNRHGPTTFTLTRRKDHVVMMLNRGGFQWNVGYFEHVKPRTFADARQWLHAYAARFGDVMQEVTLHPRMAQPKGDDRKLLRAGGCKEDWLKSDIPALWAEAMMRCQHPAGFCGQDGYCHYGDCTMEMRPPEPACAQIGVMP